MSDTVEVRLKRGPLKDASWHDAPARAQQRADHLSWLHGDAELEYLEEDGERIIVVHADAWYTPRKKRDAP